MKRNGRSTTSLGFIQTISIRPRLRLRLGAAMAAVADLVATPHRRKAEPDRRFRSTLEDLIFQTFRVGEPNSSRAGGLAEASRISSAGCSMVGSRRHMDRSLGPILSTR